MYKGDKVRLCGEFLVKCLAGGWTKDDLDMLEESWWEGEAWQYRNSDGTPKHQSKSALKAENERLRAKIDEIPIDALNTIMRAMLQLSGSVDVKFSFLEDDGLVLVFQVGRRRVSFFLEEKTILIKTTNERLETKDEVVHVSGVGRIVEAVRWVQGIE